jgi:hypothetical protein
MPNIPTQSKRLFNAAFAEVSLIEYNFTNLENASIMTSMYSEPESLSIGRGPMVSTHILSNGEYDANVKGMVCIKGLMTDIF